MSERFTRAVNALISAYANDQLYGYSCRSCAVGNIVGASLGIEPMTVRLIHQKTGGLYPRLKGEVEKNFFEGFGDWKSMLIIENPDEKGSVERFLEESTCDIRDVPEEYYEELSKKYPQIKEVSDNFFSIKVADVNAIAFRETGYSVREMQEIEYTFMKHLTRFVKSREEYDNQNYKGLCAVIDLLASWEDEIIEVQKYKKQLIRA